MKILIKNTHIGISDFSKDEQVTIQTKFTYQDKSQAMTRAGYDPKKVRNVCFVAKSKGFMIIRSGFLRELFAIIKQNRYKVTEVKDDRTKFPFQGDHYDATLRKYFDPDFDYVEHQIRALKAMLKTNIGVLKLPTSAGKSSIIEAFLKLTNVPTLILVDGVSLSAQLAGDLNKSGLDVGICNGKGVKKAYHMVSTLGSVKKLTLSNFQCVIIDETHGAAARTYQEFLSSVSFPLRYGLSATPDANGDYRWACIRQFLGSIISETFSKELLDNNVITPPKITFLPVSCVPTLDWQAAYDSNIVNNSDRNLMAVRIAEETELPTLILFKIIEHGEKLHKMLPDAVLLSGKDSLKVRQEAVERFKRGEIKTLIASNIFKQGISISNIEVLINVSGGKSKVEVLQKIGRALRKSDGKTVALVYDFLDDGNDFTHRHSLQREKLYRDAGFDDITHG